MESSQHKYLSIFVTEAGEQLAQIEGELLRIEKDGEKVPQWDAIFRKAHSVKGSAATLGLTELVDVAHAAETLIFRLKAAGGRPERAQIELLLHATDLLARMVSRAARDAGGGAENAPPETQAVDPQLGPQLAERLAAAARALPDPAERAGPPQAASQPPQAPAESDPTLPQLQVVVQLAQACAAPSARALIVQRKLRAVGVLLGMDPQPSQLMQRKGGVRIEATLATARPAAEVRNLCLSIPEVVSAAVGPLSAVPAAESRAVAAPERPSAPPRQGGEGPELRPEQTVRVRAVSLDQLLDAAGEVLLGIARLREASRKLPESHASVFEAEVDRLRRTARELHGQVMNARLTPFSALTERLPRAVRDLAHRLGKEVDLEIQGADVELDRAVIEAMGDPLSHLVRNAVDHGIEKAEERLARSKPLRGRLSLSARRERDRVIVDLEDDGRGLDGAALLRKALAAGAVTEEQARLLTPAAAAELAFLPGISTRAEVTEVSGRGVGLDAVQRAVEALGGKLSVRSQAGQGARFTVELPLAVSMSNLLLVQVGGELYGLPVPRVLVTTEYDLSARGGEGFESRSVIVGGQWVEAFGLAKLFGLPSLAPPGPRPFVVLEVDGVTFALAVDRLVGQEECVLKPLPPPLHRLRGLSAATVLGNGRPLLVLDPRGLADMAGVHKAAGSPRPAQGAA